MFLYTMKYGCKIVLFFNLLEIPIYIVYVIFETES